MSLKREFDKLPEYCQFEDNLNLLKNKWTVYILSNLNPNLFLKTLPLM